MGAPEEKSGPGPIAQPAPSPPLTEETLKAALAAAVAPKEPAPPAPRCTACNSGLDEKGACANVECAKNPAFVAAREAEKHAAKRDENLMSEARACKLCGALSERPCSPEHYRAAGYEVSDARFLSLFGPPLRITGDYVKKTQRTGHVKVRVKERIAIDGHHHMPGDTAKVEAKYVDLYPACFEELPNYQPPQQATK